MAAKSFGQRVEELRNQQSLSKSELGRSVGVSPTCVWNWEKKNRTPEKSTLVKLAAALQVSIAFLLTGKDVDEVKEDTTFDEVLACARKRIAKINKVTLKQVQITVRILPA